MNIFENYLKRIKDILIEISKNGELVLPEKLDGITAEIPPSKFNSDISTNVAMVLSKLNKKSPISLAENLRVHLKNNDKLIHDVSVAKPGFINIKFKPIFWTKFVEDVIKNSKNYGVNLNEKKK